MAITAPASKNQSGARRGWRTAAQPKTRNNSDTRTRGHRGPPGRLKPGAKRPMAVESMGMGTKGMITCLARTMPPKRLGGMPTSRPGVEAQNHINWIATPANMTRVCRARGPERSRTARKANRGANTQDMGALRVASSKTRACSTPAKPPRGSKAKIMAAAKVR